MYLASVVAVVALLVARAACYSAASEHRAGNRAPQSLCSDWSGWGGNIYNNGWAWCNEALNSSSTGNLVQHCRLSHYLGVSATPTVRGDIVYYPTWGGQFIALNYRNCQVQWNISVGDIVTQYAPISALQAGLGQAGVSRFSPQVDGNVLYFTTLLHALLVAVDRNTGVTLAVTPINLHPLAVATMSPTFYRGIVFVGTASSEEVAAAFVPGYQCCSFVDNVAAYRFNKVLRSASL